MDEDIVRARYPNATAVADYTLEAAWSAICADHDEDGLGIGEHLGVGRDHEEAWANAAKNLS